MPLIHWPLQALVVVLGDEALLLVSTLLPANHQTNAASLQELAVESFFPADDFTAQVLRKIAQENPGVAEG